MSQCKNEHATNCSRCGRVLMRLELGQERLERMNRSLADSGEEPYPESYILLCPLCNSGSQRVPGEMFAQDEARFWYEAARTKVAEIERLERVIEHRRCMIAELRARLESRGVDVTTICPDIVGGGSRDCFHMNEFRKVLRGAMAAVTLQLGFMRLVSKPDG